MKSIIRCLFYLLTIGFILVSCSGPKVPYEGAFWSKNGKLIDIPISKAFPLAVTNTAPIVNDDKPIFYLSYGQIAIENIILLNVQRNQALDIQIKKVNKDKEILEITLREKMEDGDYCLVIGNNFMALEDLPRWCFKKGEPQKIIAEATAAANRLIKRKTVSPPSEGMYYVDENLNAIDVSGIRGDGTFDLASSIVINEGYPVFVFSSSSINPQEIQLLRGVNHLGYGVLENSPCISSGGTFPQGVSITAIDDNRMESCQQIKKYIESKDLLSKVEVETTRGTNRSSNTISLSRVELNLNNSVPLVTDWGEDYAVFTVDQALQEGGYCLYKTGSRAFCFIIDNHKISKTPNSQLPNPTATQIQTFIQSSPEPNPANVDISQNLDSKFLSGLWVEDTQGAWLEFSPDGKLCSTDFSVPYQIDGKDIVYSAYNSKNKIRIEQFTNDQITTSQSGMGFVFKRVPGIKDKNTRPEGSYYFEKSMDDNTTYGLTISFGKENSVFGFWNKGNRESDAIKTETVYSCPNTIQIRSDGDDEFNVAITSFDGENMTLAMNSWGASNLQGKKLPEFVNLTDDIVGIWTLNKADSTLTTDNYLDKIEFALNDTFYRYFSPDSDVKDPFSYSIITNNAIMIGSQDGEASSTALILIIKEVSQNRIVFARYGFPYDQAVYDRTK